MAEWMEQLKVEMGVYWEILFLVLGAILGIILPGMINYFNRIQRSRMIKKRVKNLSCNDDLNILTIASANDSYLKENLKVLVQNKKYYLAFPYELREQVLKVDPCFELHDDVFLDPQLDLKQIGDKMGIEDFEARIERHRQSIAQHFIEQSNGCHNNREKLGVYQLHAKNAADKNENAGVYIKLYDTDYFTHRIMRAVYYELRDEGHAISKLKNENLREINTYNYFTTSLGINLYLIMDSATGEDIIFSQRAAHAAHEESRFKYNSTVMEGVSQSDFDYAITSHKEISLWKSAERGLEEELGVTTDEIKIWLHDFFLQKDFFEIGVTASAKLTEDMATFEEYMRDLPAKDKDLEVARLVPVPFTTNKISQFICKHDMYDQGLYTLRMVAARKGVRVLHKK